MDRQKLIRKPFRARIAPAILRRIGWLGLKLRPFIIVREGEHTSTSQPANDDFQYRFITEDELGLLVDFGPNGSLENIQKWIQGGKSCFAVWDGSRLAATMWCDFRAFNFLPNYRLLDDDEAYLFAAFTHPDYRGHSLAPEMRLHCYEKLRELGRTRFCSYTDYYNLAARRFKEKLGARNEQVRLHISLFDHWSRTITLKTF